MGASLVLGVVLFIWLYPSFLATLSLVGAVLTGILFAVLARSRHEVRQKPDTSQLCMAIQDQWKSRVDEALASTTLEGLQRELLRIQSEADVIDREIANFSNEEARIIEHISKAELEEKNAQALYENAKHTLEETYRALKVYSSEEYASRRTEYLKVKELYDELSARIENDKSIHNANTIDELKAACQLQQMSLEKECVAEKKSETESNRIKLKLEKDKAALSSLKEEFIKIKSDIESSKGELRGSFAELPKNIYEKEKKIARLKSEINILLRDMQAAAIARNIFLEIASDSDVIFTELENDIGHFIGDMLEGGRRIEFKNFSEDSILMTDAGGTMRTFNGLSTGTKDAFALAVRFSFALRSWEKEYPGIIVLDEPFHALDESRVSRIVDLIKKFHEEKAWQLVIFTKDEDLAKKLSRISNDVLMHVLPA
jgi:DNA repair exonuclease SbcCD ATPase subunit